METPDRDEFGLFVQGQQGRVLRLCAGILADSVEAQDAAQEVFVKAYRGWGTFRGESSRETWLYRIAVRHCIDRIRQRSRFRGLFAEDGSAEQAVSDLAEMGRSVQVETRLAVREVLATLAPEVRMILTLREIEGFSYEEIARIMDMSVEAVRARLARARRELARLWEKRLEEGS